MKKILIIILSILMVAQVAFAVESKVVFVDKRCANNGTGAAETCAGSPGGAGPYNTCAAAITGEVTANADLTTLAKKLVFDFRGGATADTTQCVVAGFTNTTRDYLVRFQTSGTNRAIGAWDATKYRLSISANNQNTLDVQVANFEIDGMQVEHTATGSGTYGGLGSGTGSLEILATNNNFRTLGCTGFCAAISWYPGVANTRNYFINNQITTSGVASNSVEAFRMYGSGYNAGEYSIIENNSIYGGRYAIATHGGSTGDTLIFKNNVMNGQWGTPVWNPNLSGQSYTTFTSSSNITGDTSSPDTTTCGGATCRSKTCSFTATTLGSENLALLSGDTNCRDAGVSLVTDTIVPVQNDRSLQPRLGTFDIGAYEYVASGGSSGGLINLNTTAGGVQ